LPDLSGNFLIAPIFAAQLTQMKIILGFLFLFLVLHSVSAQQMTVAQMKTEIENSPNSPLYVKQVLKKNFKIDTIQVTRTTLFNSLADSLAYTAKLKKVYGPYKQKGVSFLAQVLARAPNTFFRFSQIYIDTSVFRYRVADSLSNLILQKLNSGKDTFEHLVQTYTMGGENITNGDLGWIAEGALVPQIEKELIRRKKGDVFRVWSKNGVHIIKKTEDSKKDTGYALIMRVFL
jgi:PPIC-type PPIASE domain